MDLRRLTSTRSFMTIKIDESNDMPLFSRIRVLSEDDEGKSKDDSFYRLLHNPLYQESRMSTLSQMSSYLSASKSKKKLTYGITTSSFIDHKQVLQIITQQTADELAIILGKMGIHKASLYQYHTPEERFNAKQVFTLEEEKPLKTDEEKMLKVQQMIKTKIDEIIMFLYSILKDTSEEMRNERTFHTLNDALENIFRIKSDDLTTINMKAEELCAHLFHDIKRIEKEADRLLEGNRSIAFGSLRAKDREYFLRLKQMDYIDKWEKNRRWLHKYRWEKECGKVSDYIHDIEDQMMKDEEVTVQVTSFLELDIQELEQRRDEFPEKLDTECDFRNRVIGQLKEELENMYIHKDELAAEVKLRAQQMIDWKIYREKKAIEDAELERIAAEEELARQLEEERIAAELAAEEEYLATLNAKELKEYWKNKKKEARKAAKAAKAAKKKERRKA